MATGTHTADLETATTRTGLPPVDVALLDIAFSRLRLSVAMTVCVCLIFIGLLWPYFPSEQMSLWLLAMVVTSGTRYLLWWLYHRGIAQNRNHRTWRLAFELGAIAGGASWALGPLMLMPPAGRIESLLLVLTLLSVTAVAVATLAAQPRAMLGFTLAALGPTILALGGSGGQVELLGAAVLLAGMISLIIVGWGSSKLTRDLIDSDRRLSLAVAQTDAARSRAEAASQAKTRFLANMSHELRTPLNAVIGAAQLMRDGRADRAPQDDLVDAIERGGANLLGLIDDILDITRIEAGELVLRTDEFQLQEVLEAAMSGARVTGHAKGLAVSLSIAPDLWPWRRGDGPRLRQILLNLLGNAIKFTPAGEVSVSVRRGEPDHWIQIEVRDTGIGIAPEDLERIFEPFQQAEQAANRRFGGTGLGLAIVRQVLRAMGGWIHARSEPGQGSCFEITLPLPLARTAHGPGPASRPGPVTVPEPTRDDLSVLVAEDDTVNRTIVCRMLRNAGLAVTGVPDGRAALEALSETRFDLVVMDWQMPGMDGLEATRKIRSGSAGAAARDTPIIGLTANAFAEDRQTCLAAGMNDFLTKPVRLPELLEAIARNLPAQPSSRAPESRTSTPASNALPVEG